MTRSGTLKGMALVTRKARVTRRGFLVHAGRSLAALATVPADVARAGEDDLVRECFRRMGFIYESIRRWQRAHGTNAWPLNLASLREEGLLTDPRAWICPCSESRQNLRFDPLNPSVLDAKSFNRESNYNYEFSAEPVPQERLGDLPPMNHRAWKSALAATALGGRVPILRCKSHGEQVLNIAADGRSYRSSLYWEYEFSAIRPEPFTMPWMVVKHPEAPGETRRERPPDLPAGCLDLGGAANALPELPWIDGLPRGATLSRFVDETGAGAALHPVPFDARRMIQTTGATVNGWKEFEEGRGFLGRAYPPQSLPLSLPATPSARSLYVLQATACRGEPGQRVGEIVILSGTRTVLTLPLIYGENTGWWRRFESGGAARPVWRGEAGPSSLAGVRDHANPPPVVEAAALYVADFPWPETLRSAAPLTLQLRADSGCAASPFVLGLTLLP